MDLLKIVSEGSGFKTKILMPDGQEVPGLDYAKWECAAGGLATIELRGHGKIEAKISGGQNIKMDMRQKEKPRVPLHWRKPEDRA